jgi:putative zinc finger/helix-turn-helix YgiT family protein
MAKYIKYCDECRCDREIEIKERNKTYTFRGDTFEILERYAECTYCRHAVSSEDLDTKVLSDLNKAYELKHSYNPEMLKTIRHTYNLPQSLFAKLVNLGSATIKRYELGTSAPDSAQLGVYKLLSKDPHKIHQFFEQNKGNFDDSELVIVQGKLAPFLTNTLGDMTQQLIELVYKPFEYSLDTGNRNIDTQKLFNMVLFFTRRGVLKTKLMKLLWYADFLCFKRKGVSISGTPYWHLPYGPVPKNHEMILGTLEVMECIEINEDENEDGYTRIRISAKESFEGSLFPPDEWDVLTSVDSYFKTFGSTAISKFAHKEIGWKETVDEQIISYSYADLLQIT